jgi:hypothetical protein
MLASSEVTRSRHGLERWSRNAAPISGGAPSRICEVSNSRPITSAIAANDFASSFKTCVATASRAVASNPIREHAPDALAPDEVDFLDTSEMSSQEPTLLAGEQRDQHTVGLSPTAEERPEMRAGADPKAVRQWDCQRNLVPNAALAPSSKPETRRSYEHRGVGLVPPGPLEQGTSWCTSQ